MSLRNQITARRRPRPSMAVSLACASALALGAAGFVTSSPGVSAATTTDVQLLSFNDYHGHVEGGRTPGRIDGENAGGGEALSAKLTELRATAAGDSFTVAAGDLIGGSPFFSGLFHDEPSVETLNAMGLDVSGVGNHEFDEGVVELLRMQNGGCHPVDGCYFTDYDPDTAGDQEFGGADFQWLAANVTRDDAKAAPETADFDTDIPDFEIKTVTGGQKIAFIGMTLEGTDALVAAAGVEGFTFEDEVTSANAAVDAIQLADSDVEAIVVLLHEGGIPTPFAINGCEGISGPIVEIAAELSAEIDAVITGHTHLPYTCFLDDPDNNPRPVTSAYSFGRVVTEINMQLDTDGEVVRDTITAVNHPVIQAEVTLDPAITAILDKWQPLADAVGGTAVGNITEDITRGGDPTGSDRGVESAAGNLVADAQLAATEALGAQIALMNPGGLRSDLTFAESEAEEGDGVVTFGEAFTFQPFNNTLFVLPMTGAQIVSVLEEQCQPADSSRPFLHLGISDGLTYDLETTIQDGVCTAISVTNLQLDGVDLDPTTEYMVTTNNFLADGGDNFGTFADVAPGDRKDGGQDIDALNNFLEAAGATGVAPPPTTRVNETITTLPSSLASLTPARLLDTRTGDGNTTADGLFEGDGPIEAGGVIELTVTERGDVPGDASAVVLNIGAIRPAAEGFITASPCGEDRPVASNVNYAAGEVISTAVLAKIGTDGKVCIYSSAETNLIADVNSFVPADGSPVALSPARLLDTRGGDGNTTDDGLFEGEGPIDAGTTLELDVVDRGGVDADAAAVMLNVAAIRSAENGFLTLFSCDADLPVASNINYAAGEVTSNLATVKVSDEGKVCIYSSATVNLIADVNAFVPAGGSPEPITPARLLDTREDEKTIDGDFEGEGRVAVDDVVELVVTGRGGVTDTAETVLLNVAVINASTEGFVTISPCGEDRPVASNINFAANTIVANSVAAKIGADGKVCIFTSAETDLIADVLAAVSPPEPVRPAS